MTRGTETQETPGEKSKPVELGREFSGELNPDVFQVSIRDGKPKDERVMLAQASASFTDAGVLPGLQVEGKDQKKVPFAERSFPSPWGEAPVPAASDKDKVNPKKAEPARPEPEKEIKTKKDGPLQPNDLPELDPKARATLESDFQALSKKIFAGDLRAQPNKITPIHKNGGEVWDWQKLSWAINRPAEAKLSQSEDYRMPFNGPSTVSAESFRATLKEAGSAYADAREPVKVRLPDGSIGTVSLDMGQLAKLYEVKWREQGHISLNAAALLAQSYHEINLANPKSLANVNEAAVQRTLDTNQWAGIKWKKGTFRCEATEVNWEQVADSKFARQLKANGTWGDKKETRVWSSPGKSMCGWFEHIGEKYIANGKNTAGEIIPQYVGTNAGPHYISGFAKSMRKLGS